MTLLGKILTLLGLVPKGLETSLLDGVQALNSHKRKTWETRFNQDKLTELPYKPREEIFKLREKYPKTKLSQLYGWNLTVIKYENQAMVDILLHASNCDARIEFGLYYYDVDAFLRACNRTVGVNMDELNWLLEYAAKKDYDNFPKGV